MKDKIIALAKFLSNGEKNGKSYADILLDGNIYMRSASHFVHQEHVQQVKGQGDQGEGIAFRTIRCGMDKPVYCLYTIWTSDCIGQQNKKTVISSRIIEEFCQGESGNVVLIDYPKFIERIQTVGLGGYAALCQPVIYGQPSIEEQMKLLTTAPEKFLLFKASFFSYQKEFRIISYKSLPFLDDGKYKKFGDLWDKEYGDITYSIGDIRGFSEKIPIFELEKDANGDYLLPIQ